MNNEFSMVGRPHDGTADFRVGDWVVEPRSRRISGPGRVVQLEPRVMAVLMHLVAHAGDVVTNDDLIHHVWNNRPMGENPIYRCVAQLRNAFADSGYIETVPKTGYRLVAPVRALEARPPERWSQHRRVLVWPAVGLLLVLALAAWLIPRDAPDAPTVPILRACDGTASLAACQRYQLAHENLRTRTHDYKERALTLLQEAIDIDPGFAAAHAAIASTYLLPGDEFPWAEAVRHATGAVDRALELDSSLPEAHSTRALLLMTDERGPCPPTCRVLDGYPAAEAAARNAVALAPSAIDANYVLASALIGQGRLADAVDHLAAILEQDPLHPWANYQVTLNIARTGDHQAALRHVLMFIDQQPSVPALMYATQAMVEHYYGNYDRSLRALRTLAATRHDPFMDWLLSQNYHHLGMWSEIEVLLDSRRHAPHHALLNALMRHRAYVARGEHDAVRAHATELEAAATAEFGAPDSWQRWQLQIAGQARFWLGDYEGAADLLLRVHGDDGLLVDYSVFSCELDSIQMLGYSLQAIGDARGDAFIENTLTLVADRRAQGYGNLPVNHVAEARAYAIQGRRSLAVSSMREAVASGWRSYTPVSPHDPRWSAVAGDAEFQSSVALARDSASETRARVTGHLARAH